jgi:hypothetical protein
MKQGLIVNYVVRVFQHHLRYKQVTNPEDNRSKPMGFRDQVKSTEARRQSEYITEGQYLFEIIGFKEDTSRKGRDYVVVEMKTLDASDDNRNPKGSERSWLQMCDTDTAPKNIRGFLSRALNVPDESLTDTMIDKAFEPKKSTGMSPLVGVKVGVNAHLISTKAGNPFTVVNFSSVDQSATSLEDL